MLLVDRVQSLIVDSKKWSIGRPWIWRVPVLLYVGWAGYRHLVDPTVGDLFSGITLGVHELGHLLTSWAPEIVTVAAGSVAQILVPLGLVLGFMRQRDYFSIAVGGSWLSCSLFNLAAYIGDARAQQLPLLGTDPNPIHDWNFLLGAWGILPMDTQIAEAVGLLAAVILFASVGWGVWVCGLMIANPGPAKKQYAKY